LPAAHYRVYILALNELLERIVNSDHFFSTSLRLGGEPDSSAVN